MKRDEQVFGRQVLTAIVEGGTAGKDRREVIAELAAQTGASETEVLDMLRRLRAAGYIETERRWQTEH